MTNASQDSLLLRAARRVEALAFGHRRALLVFLALFTLVMGWFALQLRMDAGFEKQMPVGHEYIETFKTYRADVLGANRLNIVVKARRGDIWNAAALKRLYEVTQAVSFLPSVERLGVQSLWTPNSFVNEITEEGFRADPLIEASVTPHTLTQGPVTLVTIWATWCIPCRAEMPAMASLYRALGPKGFRLIAVSIDESAPKDVLDFVKDLGLTFEVLHDKSGDIQRVFQTTGVPESFLLDKNGVIVKKVIGEHPWSSQSNQRIVAELLGAN